MRRGLVSGGAGAGRRPRPGHRRRAADRAAAAQASDVVAGLVTKIDLERSRVTVRSSDGNPHEFEASAETLKDLKVGDRIEATRRPTTD